MFDMSNDSHLFRTREELEDEGYMLEGNRFVRDNEVFLPLYEAKMIHQFTHRWATYEADGSTRDMTLDELCEPIKRVMPRYWVKHKAVQAQTLSNWLFAFRKTSRATDERTIISTIIPIVAIGDKAPLIFANSGPQAMMIASCLNSLICDFTARQKVGGIDISFFYLKQFPVLPPHTYTPALLDFIVPRVLELTYTAWDLQAFAQDVGYDGPPFIWDEERRFLMRCELDALYFHLYQIPRDDVDYIMETFPIVKRKDIAATAGGEHPTQQQQPPSQTLAPGGEGLQSPHRPLGEGDLGGEGNNGTYITKDTILQMYDEMAALPFVEVPHPKQLDEAFTVPDVSQFETWLSPPPADPSVAHEDRREG